MATTTFNAAPINDTDANFRLWGSQLGAAIAAVGLVNITSTITSATAIGGTGGPTWANISKPAAIDTFPGYEVFRFDDALQATLPVFIKVEYGSNHSGTNGVVPAVRITVGQAITLATGAFSGQTTSALEIGMNTGTSGSATLAACYVSGATSRINVAMFTSLNQAVSFYVERSKDDSGANTADFIEMFGWAGTSSVSYCGQQILPASGSAYPLSPNVVNCAMPMVGQGSWGDNVGLYPTLPNLGWSGNPTLGACMYFTGDIAAAGSMIAVSLYGSTHTYVTVGVASSAAVNGNTTAHCVAMRYE